MKKIFNIDGTAYYYDDAKGKVVSLGDSPHLCEVIEENNAIEKRMETLEKSLERLIALVAENTNTVKEFIKNEHNADNDC